MDVEKTIEFILGMQAQFAADMASLTTEVRGLTSSVQGLSEENRVIARAVHKLIEVSQENSDASVAQRKQAEVDRRHMQDIREDLHRTMDDVEAVIKVVDELVRRKNGDGH
jgi:hypothetical protein